MSGEKKKLKELLGSGWRVVGFQQTTEALLQGPKGEDLQVSQTGGYLILLQNNADLAVCQVGFDDMEHYVDAIHFLTDMDQ